MGLAFRHRVRTRRRQAAKSSQDIQSQEEMAKLRNSGCCRGRDVDELDGAETVDAALHPAACVYVLNVPNSGSRIQDQREMLKMKNRDR